MSLRSFASRTCSNIIRRGIVHKGWKNNGPTSHAVRWGVQSFSSTSKDEKETKDPNELIPPTMEMAQSMATGLSQMDNTTLCTIAALGHHEAGCEVLKRHIMSVDGVPYKEACVKFEEIAKTNRGSLNLAVMPYLAGISLGLIGAVGSLPMVFDLNTALWFNEGYVTTDIPEPRDLETFLEVGSWTWNWMEPPLGTMSFVLLCLQYARGQIQNLGLHPYTSAVRQRRAIALAERYPQYSSEVLIQYSTSDPLIGGKF